jgi:Tol biopolymer transport system component
LTFDFVQTMFAERNVELAPKGQWLAYESNESGRPEIYVRPFPNVDSGRWQVSTGGGSAPLAASCSTSRPTAPSWAFA